MSTEPKMPVGVGVFVLVSLVPAIALRGWVLAKMWGWFVVDSLGLLPMTTASAIGVMLIVHLFKEHSSPAKSAENVDWAEAVAKYIGTALCGPLVVLLMGYIVSMFL